ncbi:MAG: iron-containing alcohol dehydrogenase [Pseudomonadota bacterium]
MPTGLLDAHDYGFPVPIAYGPGRFAEIADHCARYGIMRPLIVTDRGSKDLPFIGRLVELLGAAGLTNAVFSDISPNPRDDEIEAGCAALREGDHDAVIGIGGGSAMDGGKAVCLKAHNDIDLWDFDIETSAPSMAGETPFPKLICVPTTSGTGAETESTAMVTDTVKGMKFCVWHPELKPSVALLDPELTLGLPPNLTAWTGADALTHAIEAYTVPVLNPLCDGMALEALSLISTWLEVAAQDPDNLEARGGMLLGSCLAGISFIKGLGHVHAISHMVGAEFDTQHGLTNAIVLPVVLRYNLPGLPEKTQRMAEAMGLGALRADQFCSHVSGILDRLDIPKGLHALDVDMASAERLASKALLDAAAGTNPRQSDQAEMQALIEEAITGAR